MKTIHTTATRACRLRLRHDEQTGGGKMKTEPNLGATTVRAGNEKRFFWCSCGASFLFFFAFLSILVLLRNSILVLLRNSILVLLRNSILVLLRNSILISHHSSCQLTPQVQLHRHPQPQSIRLHLLHLSPLHRFRLPLPLPHPHQRRRSRIR